MPGRKRCRSVAFQPHFLCFEPRGEDATSRPVMWESILKVEELESIRLKDYLRLSQDEAAERMGVSQPTFHRILREARRKIAEAFIEGKAIRIEGGDYVLTMGKDEALGPGFPPGVPPGWTRGRKRRGRVS